VLISDIGCWRSFDISTEKGIFTKRWRNFGENLCGNLWLSSFLWESRIKKGSDEKIFSPIPRKKRFFVGKSVGIQAVILKKERKFGI
jgi:hypothetical protein